MPLVSTIFSGLLVKELVDQGLRGIKTPQLAMAIADGITTNILATAVYQGVGTGLGVGIGMGTGAVSGLIGPNVAFMIFNSEWMQNILGAKAFQLATAIGNAFANFIITATVTSTCATVAVGSGTGKIVGLVGEAMGMSIFGMMSAQGLVGANTLQLATAIGQGICNSITVSAIVNTFLVGVPIGPVPPFFPPIPVSGPDIGKLF
jgi:hypothetical protein